MPVNRYGSSGTHHTGYSSVYGMYSFPKYSSMYTSSHSLGRCGSSSPALVRASTPSSTREPYSYSSIMSSVLPEERNYNSRSKSRMHPYETERNEVKTIKTEDIDVESQKNGRTTAKPGEIKRDTTLKLPGGKAVVRMITQKLKDYSYVTKIIPEDEEGGSGKLTLGQRLALKYQMKERPKKQKTPSPPQSVNNNKSKGTAGDDSGSESDWTWETCSSSEAEDWPATKKDSSKQTTSSKSLLSKPPIASTTKSSIMNNSTASALSTFTTPRASQPYTRSNTTSLCTKQEESASSSLRSSAKSSLDNERSTLPYSLYLRNNPVATRTVDRTENLPTLRKSSLTSTSSLSRPVSWAGSQAASQALIAANTQQTVSVEEERSRYLPSKIVVSSTNSSSSSSPSGSPSLYKFRKPMRYGGAGSTMLPDSDDENLNIGWRKGQPPRGDVVVKLKGKTSSSAASSHAPSKCTTPMRSVPPTPVPPLKLPTPEPDDESSWEYYTESDPDSDHEKPTTTTPSKDAPKAAQDVGKASKNVKKDVISHPVEIDRVVKSSAQYPVKDTIPIPKPVPKLELKFATENPKPKDEAKPVQNPHDKTKANMFEDIRDIKQPAIKLFSSGKLEKVGQQHKPVLDSKQKPVKDSYVSDSIKGSKPTGILSKSEPKPVPAVKDDHIKENKICDVKKVDVKIKDSLKTDTVKTNLKDKDSKMDANRIIVQDKSKVEVPAVCDKSITEDQAGKKDTVINDRAVNTKSLVKDSATNDKTAAKDLATAYKTSATVVKDQAVGDKAVTKGQAVIDKAVAKDQIVDNKAIAKDQAVSKAAVKNQTVNNSTVVNDQAVINSNKAVSEESVNNKAVINKQAVSNKAEIKEPSVKNKTLIKDAVKHKNEKPIVKDSANNISKQEKLKSTEISNDARKPQSKETISKTVKDKESCDTPEKKVPKDKQVSKVKQSENIQTEESKIQEKTVKDLKPKLKPEEQKQVTKVDEVTKEKNPPKQLQDQINPPQLPTQPNNQLPQLQEHSLQQLPIEELPRLKTDGGQRLTVEENCAIIRLYGGVMFQDDKIVQTPKSLLFESREQYSAASSDVSSSGSPLRFSESEDEESGFLPCLASRSKTQTVNPRLRPAFRKYTVNDFQFLRVLGKGSFGKVLLASLNGDSLFYAVKALRKDTVLEDDDIECILIERKVLALGVEHPFICYLFSTFQTDSHLFYAMEYLNGGDLMFHIQQEGRFSIERARFYAAEIACALRFLHANGIVYRDLKLDNLLLDAEGHIRIVDFGMCKLDIYLDRSADTFCGTPDYMAPEIIRGLKYSYSVDWWSFGILLYEMLVGQSPFNGCDEEELFWSICNEQPYFPRFLPREPLHLLAGLLEKNSINRIGLQLFQHPFFKPIDFDLLERKQVDPPFIPKLNHPLDVSYFDTVFTEEPIKLTPVHDSFLHNVEQTQFKGFSYTNKLYCD